MFDERTYPLLRLMVLLLPRSQLGSLFRLSKLDRLVGSVPPASGFISRFTSMFNVRRSSPVKVEMERCNQSIGRYERHERVMLKVSRADVYD